MATYRNYHQESGAVSLDVPVENIPNAYGGGGLPSWFQSGDGSPVGSVTPSQQGALYQDTTNGALYEAVGVTDADWVIVGGDVAGQFTPGFGMALGTQPQVLAKNDGSWAVLSDEDNMPFGRGIIWAGDPTAPVAKFILANKTWQLNDDGGLQLPGGNSLYNTAAAPDNAVGADGDWSLGADGHVYWKSSGSWTQKV